jgi:hypothetical protein
MFFAALRSAFCTWAQATHSNNACVLRLSAAVWPQALQAWLVYAGGTATSITPEHAALYSSMLRAIDQPLRRMVRFSPAFCFTFLPGTSSVPAAEAVIELTARSSMAMSACSRTSCVVR